MKRFLAIFLAAIMIFSVSGCKKQQTSSNNEKVTLRWIMPGPGKQQDSEKVWAKFNEELAKVIPGLKVEFDVIATADYKQKYSLMLVGREKVDLVSTYTLDYNTEVRNKSFIPLDDLVKNNAPEISKQLPDWLLSYGRRDGKLYSIPVYQMMQAQIVGLRTPTELAKKYLDVNKLQNIFVSHDTTTEDAYDAVEDYLEKLKANNELGLGISGTLNATQGYENIVSPYSIKIKDEKPTIVNVWETPEMKLNIEKAAEWYQKGYIRKDVLSSGNVENDIGRKGGYTVWSNQYNKYSQINDSKKYNMDITIIPMQDYYYIPSSAAAGGTAISSKCENPEMAIKFLELMNTDKGKDLYRLLVFGIEGEHYTKVSENRIETIGYTGQATSSAPYGLLRWIIGNTALAYESQTEPEGWNDYVFKEINEGGTKSKVMGFVPNTEKISTKLAQVNAVKGEYQKSLGSGALPNYKEVYDEFINKLNTAGNKEIIAELQRQLDEFMAAK